MKNLYIKAKNIIFKNKITKIIFTLLLIATIFLIFKLISGKLGKNTGEVISVNKVVTLKKGSVTNSVSEKGRVVPSNSLEVFAEKPLSITNINVKVGDQVTRGQMIASPAQGLSVGIHATISGKVTEVTDRWIVVAKN